MGWGACQGENKEGSAMGEVKTDASVPEFLVRSRRWKVLHVSAHALLDTLRYLPRHRGVWCTPELPADAKVVGVLSLREINVVHIGIESRAFEPVPDGQDVPELKVEFHLMPKDAEDL